MSGFDSDDNFFDGMKLVLGCFLAFMIGLPLGLVANAFIHRNDTYRLTCERDGVQTFDSGWVDDQPHIPRGKYSASGHYQFGPRTYQPSGGETCNVETREDGVEK